VVVKCVPALNRGAANCHQVTVFCFCFGSCALFCVVCVVL
jgi:hypothetical protein